MTLAAGTFSALGASPETFAKYSRSIEPCAEITGNAEGVIATLPEPLVLHPLILSAIVLEPLKLS